MSFTQIIDQGPTEDLHSLAVRIGMIPADLRTTTGVSIWVPDKYGYSPPLLAEVVLAVAVMYEAGLFEVRSITLVRDNPKGRNS